MNSTSCAAYAKINLTLDIGARRADGYHDIRSIMQTIDLHDTLTFTQTPNVPGVRLDVTGPEADGVPANETNLVHKAAVRMQKIAAALGILPGNQSGLHIVLEKRIPSQAGLGGGSSDAASTLVALNGLLGLNLPLSRLSKIGAALGADVPFFLFGGTVLVEGLGEKVTPLPPLSPSWPLVIIKPNVGVSTAAAYAALDAVPDRQAGHSTEWWLSGEQTLHNDFEPVVLPAYPAVGTAYSLLSQTAGDAKCFKPLLCGSGAALFLRTSTLSAAEEITTQVQAARVGKVWTTQTREAEDKG